MKIQYLSSKKKNDSSKYINIKSPEVFVKKYRFSYIRPVDGATRLIVYNCSTVTDLK